MEISGMNIIFLLSVVDGIMEEGLFLCMNSCMYARMYVLCILVCKRVRLANDFINVKTETK